jgi:hypothetical protein
VQQPADLSQIDKSTRDEGARKIRNSDQVQQPAEKSLRIALIVQLVKEQGVLIKKKILVVGLVPGKKDHTERLANGEKGRSLCVLY